MSDTAQSIAGLADRVEIATERLAQERAEAEAPPLEPPAHRRVGAYLWRVTTAGTFSEIKGSTVGNPQHETIDIRGDSCHITASGCLVIGGSLPKTPVLAAWGAGEWLSVELVEGKR
jgi:hypothetical protein